MLLSPKQHNLTINDRAAVSYSGQSPKRTPLSSCSCCSLRGPIKVDALRPHGQPRALIGQYPSLAALGRTTGTAYGHLFARACAQELESNLNVETHHLNKGHFTAAADSRAGTTSVADTVSRTHETRRGSFDSSFSRVLRARGSSLHLALPLDCRPSEAQLGGALPRAQLNRSSRLFDAPSQLNLARRNGLEHWQRHWRNGSQQRATGQWAQPAPGHGIYAAGRDALPADRVAPT